MACVEECEMTARQTIDYFLTITKLAIPKYSLKQLDDALEKLKTYEAFGFEEQNESITKEIPVLKKLILKRRRELLIQEKEFKKLLSTFFVVKKLSEFISKNKI